MSAHVAINHWTYYLIFLAIYDVMRGGLKTFARCCVLHLHLQGRCRKHTLLTVLIKTLDSSSPDWSESEWDVEMHCRLVLPKLLHVVPACCKTKKQTKRNPVPQQKCLHVRMDE